MDTVTQWPYAHGKQVWLGEHEQTSASDVVGEEQVCVLGQVRGRVT